VPNTEKYLEYALMGIELDIAAHDSVATSYIYLHLSNALIQTGFVNEAEKYIALSAEYYPENPYSEILRIYILLAKNGDLLQTRELLHEELEKDSSRIDVLKELGVISYFMHDFEAAYGYFQQLFAKTQAEGMDLYDGEKAKLGLILAELGRMKESEIYFQEYLEYAENSESFYQGLSLAAYYAYHGDSTKAIEYLRQFAEQEKYPYWYILFLGFDDPLFENVAELPEYQKIITQIERKFWKYHKDIKDRLKDKDLI
jgi:tetratricopeptide (TPR) repeat protein